MKDKKTLFIIESPLQIMCAYEAIKEFQFKKVRIITRLADIGRNNEQMCFLIDTLLADYEVKRIYVKPQSRSLKSIFISIILSFQVFFLYVQNYNVFIGYYKSMFAKMLTFFVKSDRRIYLDDGTATLNTPPSILNRSYYFSIFDISTSFLIKNRFVNLSNFLLKNKENRKDVIIFIGSPIRQIEPWVKGDYFRTIEKIKQKYESLDFFYFPHRRELKEDLDKISSYGIQVVANKYPIEMFYYEFVGYHPKVVASLYSSAMFTMNLIYGSKVVMCNGVIKENIPDLVNVFNAIKKIEDIGVVEC